MVAFTPILKQLVVEIINTRSLPSFNPTGFYLIGLAGIFGILGLGFLLFAGFLQIQEYYSADIAALITAAAGLGLALIVGLIGKKQIDDHILVSKANRPHGDIAGTVTQLLDTLGEELEEPIRENPKTALMMASLAGFLAGGHGHHHRYPY